MKNFEAKPVVISAITLTQPTQTKMNLQAGDLDKLLAMALTQDQMNNLTVKVEFKQQREVYSVQDPKVEEGKAKRKGAFDLSVLLKGHANSITNVDRNKLDWANAVTLTALKELGWAVGVELSNEDGRVFFILNENFDQAVFRDGKIVSSPKRLGKDGDVLLDEYDRLIFQSNTLVDSTMKEFDGFDYNQFMKFEIHNQTKYTSTIKKDEVPEETKTNGFFNVEFQEWIQKYYLNTNTEVLQEVA